MNFFKDLEYLTLELMEYYFCAILYYHYNFHKCYDPTSWSNKCLFLTNRIAFLILIAHLRLQRFRALTVDSINYRKRHLLFNLKLLPMTSTENFKCKISQNPFNTLYSQNFVCLSICLSVCLSVSG